MLDIDFYRQVHGLKQRLLGGEPFDSQEVFDTFERYRSRCPVVYNIETTNLCNMSCKMCPRTTMMTRPIEELSMKTYSHIVKQLRPWRPDEWETWQDFVELQYGIERDGMSENHFFLYIIPKVIQLHGYGAPLLDKHIVERIERLTEQGIPSYFSCNPSNIGIRGIEQDLATFEAGLDYCKYSIESVDNRTHKDIRGPASNFTDAYKKILYLLNEKEKRNLKTTIVITMLDLNRPNQAEEWAKLQEKFNGLDVYIYFKSEDQQWYRKQYHGTKSIHWTEICQMPWLSMTVKSNGDLAMCMEDFNNEIVLGDGNVQDLLSVWNGKSYGDFRRQHFERPVGIKCVDQCDMKLIGDMLR